MNEELAAKQQINTADLAVLWDTWGEEEPGGGGGTFHEKRNQEGVGALSGKGTGAEEWAS